METQTHDEGTRGALIDALSRRLEQLSDELVVVNHAATEEVRDAVQIVAHEIGETATKLKATRALLQQMQQEATVQAHLGLLEVNDRIEVLAAVVKRALAGASKAPTFIGETARMKIALAQMDVNDLVTEKLAEKRRLLREEQRRVQRETDLALREIEARIHRIDEARRLRSKP